MHGQFLAQSTWSWLHFILQLKSLISHSTIQCDKLVRHFVVHSTEASASLKMKSLFLFPSINHFYMQSLYATLRIITGRIIFNGSNWQFGVTLCRLWTFPPQIMSPCRFSLDWKDKLLFDRLWLLSSIQSTLTYWQLFPLPQNDN